MRPRDGTHVANLVAGRGEAGCGAHVADIRPGGVGLDAEHKVAGLPVVANRAAGETAADAPMSEPVFLRVAAHRADVETGPVLIANARGRLGVGPGRQSAASAGAMPSATNRLSSAVFSSLFFLFATAPTQLHGPTNSVARGVCQNRLPNTVAAKATVAAEVNLLQPLADAARAAKQQKGRREAGLFRVPLVLG